MLIGAECISLTSLGCCFWLRLPSPSRRRLPAWHYLYLRDIPCANPTLSLNISGAFYSSHMPDVKPNLPAVAGSQKPNCEAQDIAGPLASFRKHVLYTIELSVGNQSNSGHVDRPQTSSEAFILSPLTHAANPTLT
jgi:hypothetical protein